MSKVLRRSGNAVVNYLDVLGWKPKQVVMVGVGGHHDEVDVMRDAWGRDFELYGIEAHPLIYKDLRNTFPGIIQHAAAVGPHFIDRHVDLFAKSNWKDGSTTHQPRGPDAAAWEIYHVPPLILDDWAHPLFNEREVLLWLDCEGSELEALRGGKRFLRDHVAVVNVELTGKPRMSGWPRAHQVHSWLISQGFHQAWIHSIRPSIAQFDSIYLRGDIYNPALSCCMDAALTWALDAPTAVLSQP